MENDVLRRIPIIVTGAHAHAAAPQIQPCLHRSTTQAAPFPIVLSHRISLSHQPPPAAGNDFSTVFAPLVRDGRMDKFYWQPTQEDLIGILHQARRCVLQELLHFVEGLQVGSRLKKACLLAACTKPAGGCCSGFDELWEAALASSGLWGRRRSPPRARGVACTRARHPQAPDGAAAGAPRGANLRCLPPPPAPQMYRDDGLSEGDMAALLRAFPGQTLDFFGALRWVAWGAPARAPAWLFVRLHTAQRSCYPGRAARVQRAGSSPLRRWQSSPLQRPPHAAASPARRARACARSRHIHPAACRPGACICLASTPVVPLLLAHVFCRAAPPPTTSRFGSGSSTTL